MRTIFRNIFLIVAIISALLLTACGGGSVDNINPVAPATQTGTLQGTVTLPPVSLRENIDKSASDTTIIASNTKTENALRASQNLKGTKVWLEDLPDIFSFTDDEGNYTIGNVPFGKHRVIASIIIDNDEYKWCSEVQNVINSIVKIVPQIVMQPAKISISGIVYDSVSKDAIQEVIVEVWGQKSTTDANGKYTVFNMPAGTWDVTYSKNGYQTITTPMSFEEGNETSGNFYLVPVGNNVPVTASDSSSVVLKELIPAYNANSVSIQTTISAFFNGAKN